MRVCLAVWSVCLAFGVKCLCVIGAEIACACGRIHCYCTSPEVAKRKLGGTRVGNAPRGGRCLPLRVNVRFPRP